MPTIPKVLQPPLNAILNKIQHSPLYYSYYNNTIPIWTNEAYRRYFRKCSAEYIRKHGRKPAAQSPLYTQSAQLLRGALPAEKARAFSAKMDAFVNENHPCVVRPKGYEDLQARITSPLQNLGMDLLDVFRQPAVHEAILAFFQGNYRIEWVAALRNYPSDRKAASWLWHSDSYPFGTCKLMLHFTPVNPDTGATEFMNREDTMAYRKAGYFGQYLDQRYADLQEFAKDRGLPYRPYHFDAEPGDATLFDMNFFHRAVAPRKGIRDVVQFLLMPSAIPWDEQLKRDGNLSMQPQEKLPPVPRKG